MEKKRLYLWWSVALAWLTPILGFLFFSFGMGPNASSGLGPAVLAGVLMAAVGAVWVHLLLATLLVWLIGKSLLARTLFLIHLGIAAVVGLLALAFGR